MSLLVFSSIFFGLLVSGVPIWGSLSFIFLVGIQTMLGHILFGQVRGSTPISFKLEPTRMISGIVTFSVASQLFRLISQATIPIYGICALTSLAAAKSLHRRWSKMHKVPRWKEHLISSVAVDGRDFTFIAASGLLMLSQTWFWLRLPAILFAIALVLQLLPKDSLLHRFKLSLLIYAISATSLAAGIKLRPTNWWLPSWGVDERKMFADGVANWGPFADILSAGIHFKYQWLTYGVLGDWSKYSQLSTWDVVAKADLVVAAIIIPLLIWQICLELGLSTTQSRYSVLASSSLVTILSYPVGYSLMSINYMPFATTLILGAYLQTLRWARIPTSKSFILLSFFGLAAVAAKSVHILSLAIGTVALGVWSFNRSRQRILLVQSLLFTALLFLYSRIFFPSSSMSGLKVTRIFSFLGELGIDTQPKVLTLFLGILLLFVWCFPILGVLISEGFPKEITPNVIWLSTTGLSGVVIAALTTRIMGTQLHFVQVPITVALSVFPATFFKNFTQMDRRGNKYLIIATVSFYAVLGIIVIRIIAVRHVGFIADLKLLLIQLSASLVVGILALGLFNKIFAVGHRNSIAIGIFSSMLLTFLLTLHFNPQRLIHQPNGGYQLGTPEMQEAAVFVNQNAEIDEVVATDLLFSDTTTLCQSLTPDTLGTFVDDARKQNFFTPAVLTERRFLVAAPAYGFIFSDISPDERIALSLNFGCHPDKSALEGLRKLGVTWFLTQNVDISVATWEKFGQVAFRNSEYLVLYLGTE